MSLAQEWSFNLFSGMYYNRKRQDLKKSLGLVQPWFHQKVCPLMSFLSSLVSKALVLIEDYGKLECNEKLCKFYI